MRLQPLRWLLLIPDLVVTGVGAVGGLVAFVIAAAFRRGASRGTRRLLVLDMAWTRAEIEERGLAHAVTSRDLDGFFERVWTVHALSGAAAPVPPYGPPLWSDLAPRHRMIEGRVGLSSRLRLLPRTNLFLSQLVLFLALDRLVRREQVDLVQAGDPYFQGPMAWLLARANRIPFVVRVGGNYDEIHAATGRRAFPRLYPARWLEKRVGRSTLRRADLVVAPNQNNLSFALKNGARPGRTAIFPYGDLIHPAHFVAPQERPGVRSVRAELGLGNGPVLACVGRLSPVKHSADLLTVLATVRSTAPDVSLVLVGDGPLRPGLEAHAERTGQSHAIRFAGNRQQGWIADLLPSVDVIVSPHMGRALVEAALGGRPLVAYDNDWQAEMCITDKTGILVPMGDVDAMAQAVLGLLADPARAEALGRGARAHALATMDPKQLVAHQRSILERLWTAPWRPARRHSMEAIE